MYVSRGTLLISLSPQVIHQQDLVKKAIQQVKDIESSDDDAMYMGCDDDEGDDEANYDEF